jgi:hypothetical protein
VTLSLIRKSLPYLTVVILAAIAYDGWFFYSRWREAREAERMSQAEEAEQARRTIDMLGGGRLKILHFYASPGVIRRGEPANICYGVYGAKSVRIEPMVEELRPAVARCLQASPLRTTAYKLVAEDGLGHTATQQFVLRVEP